MSHYFYLARCGDGSLYAGTCLNLAQREAKHNEGTGAKYTRSRLPVKIVHHEEYRTLSEARSREASVKQWTKAEKEALATVRKSPAEQRPRICISVIGMNGVGKSNFGRVLASKLQLHCVDVDGEFRKIHGNMEAFIEKHGWETFRLEEEKIVTRCLLPGYVVVLGGGAVESPGVRKQLKNKSTVIWLQGNEKRIQSHLRKAKRPRPEFRRGITSSSVKNLMERRAPHYEELAHIRVPPHATFSEQAPLAVELLKKLRLEKP